MRRIAGILKVERRVSPRFQCRIRVLYVVGGVVLEADTVDISEQGMCLQTGVEIDVGTELLLHLEPQANLDTPRLQGRVMWMRRDTAAAGEMFLCGLKFEPLSEPAAARVREVIAACSDRTRRDLPEAAEDDVVELPPPEPPASSPAAIEAALSADHGQRAADVRHAESFLRRGKEAAQRGDLQTAVTLLEQAADQMPDSLDAVEELARVVYMQGDIVRAAALFDRALRVKQEKR